MKGRLPSRSARPPAIGAASMRVPVQGRVRIPAWSGEWPSEVCRNCAIRNSEPMTAAYWQNVTAFAVENPRERKRPSGTIGWRARRSQATNAPTSAAPPASVPSTSGVPQPTGLARAAPPPPGERPQHLGGAPADGVGAHQPPRQAEEAGGDEPVTDDVELRAGAE